MKNKLLTITFYEVVGTSWVALIIFFCNFDDKYYVMAPFLAIPAGSAVDLMGNILFRPLRDFRKLSFKVFSHTRKKVIDPKSEEMLFMTNVNRSFFIILFITAWLAFTSWDERWWVLPTSLSLSIIMLIQTFRFEFYFKNYIYERVPNNKKA